MSNIFTHPRIRHSLRAAVLATLTVSCLSPAPAHAWVSFGFALPPVVIAPAPVAPYPYAYPPPYYPAPAYPAPAYPPAYYPAPPPAQPAYPQQAPQQSQAPELSQNQPVYGTTCFAGNYTCAAAAYAPQGSACTCPGIGAPSYGTVQ